MPDKQRATNLRTGEEVEIEVPTYEEAYVQALLRERQGYERYGQADRIKDVDAELKRLGVTRDQAHKGTERAVSKKTEKRG